MDTSFNIFGHEISITPQSGSTPLTASGPMQGSIGVKEIQHAADILKKYKDGKSNLETRIVDNERWYKMRHWEIIRNKYNTTAKTAIDVEPTSAWLFNSLANKHADAMDNYPEPNVLPRERGDEKDAQSLGNIIPVIIERNEFEETYSDAWWYKLKNGTVPYGVFWDKDLENGLGDITIRKMDILNIFWEPGVSDIQKSRNLFIVALEDDDLLQAAYPWIKGGNNNVIDVKEYIYDDTVDTSGKSVVVDWYYKVKQPGGKTILHYVKFVGNTLLYASENDELYAESGWYDHGQYPVIFDVLFPEEGTPLGFGYVDIMLNPQMYIDKLNQIIMKNALMAGKKRFFIKNTGGVNEGEFADWSKDFIHVDGPIDEAAIREFTVSPLQAYIVQHLVNKVDELKETSGNRDFSQGGTSGGVTAAAAIAALQESGNKLSRDMLKGSYRVYTKVVYMCIELIRQFYDEERSFRIEGEQGDMQFIPYSNANIKEQPLPQAYEGEPPAFRVPIFDIKVKPQKSNPFSRAAQNEMAKEFYSMGFFDPARADQALAALDMMDFEGKQKTVQHITQNGTMFQMIQEMQIQMDKMALLIQKAYGVDMGIGQQTQQSTPGVATGEANSGGIAQAMGQATKNANSSYAERLADRAQPNISKQGGMSA